MESTHLPASLVQAFATGTVTQNDGTAVPLSSNISFEEAEALYQVVRGLGPLRSAEVGFAQGVSTTAILQALEDAGTGEHHVIDPFQDRFGDAGLAMVRAAGMESRLRFHRLFAEEVFPALPALQFVFIDSSHLFDLTITEFVLADKKLEVGGLIGFHDMWMPSLRKVVRYVLKNRAYRIRSDPVRKKTSSRDRVKNVSGRILAALPGVRRLLRSEVLEPWSEKAQGNMIILEKLAHDARDWRFHEEF